MKFINYGCGFTTNLNCRLKIELNIDNLLFKIKKNTEMNKKILNFQKSFWYLPYNSHEYLPTFPTFLRIYRFPHGNTSPYIHIVNLNAILLREHPTCSDFTRF